MQKEKVGLGKIQFDKKKLRKVLSKAQYNVTQEGGTEPPFSNDSFSKEIGSFHCICCDQELFLSESKFESGTGWPSFFKAANNSALELIPDFSYMMVRTEAKCSRCAAHLGHVFDDGPQPTRMRFCINGSALNFKKRV